MKDTKSKILVASLELFASKGYEATSVSDIAAKLGITKAALYKHYKNKQDIFDSILAETERQDAEAAREFSLPETELSDNLDEYSKATVESVFDFSIDRFKYWTQQEFPSLFRRMLTIEQYRSSELMQLYQQYFISGPLDYTIDIFVSNKTENPIETATALCSAMVMYYSIYDSAENKEAVVSDFERYVENLRSNFNVQKRKENLS